MVFKIILSIILFLGTACSVFDIGKERKPITASYAFFSIIADTLIVLGLWFLM